MFLDSKREPIAVTVLEASTMASRIPSNPALGDPVSDPRCAPKKVVTVAVKEGVNVNPTVSIHYRKDSGMSTPAWIVFGSGGSAEVDDAECK
jgi:hypothetical protein